MTPLHSAEVRGRLRRQLSCLPDLVRLVRSAAESFGMAEEVEYALQLVAEELFTNMIKYGAQGGPEVSVFLFREVGQIRMVFEDPGASPFDPTTTKPRDFDRPASMRRPGGLGMHLVRQYMDDFRYEHNGKAGITTVIRRLERPRA